MSYQGFSAELDKLKAVASNGGPIDVAETYAGHSLASLRQADDLTASAMAGAMFAGVRAEWSEAISYLMRIMERNHETLQLGKEAILEIERRYRVLEGQ